MKVYLNANIIKYVMLANQRRYEDQWDKTEIPEIGQLHLST